MKYCILCYEDVKQGVSIVDYFFTEDVLCGRCRSKLIVFRKGLKKDDLCIYACYLYNDFIENMLFQFKEGRDIALKEAFFYRFKKEIFDKFKDYTIVYLPSHSSKIKERGFFPLEEMLSNIDIPKIQVFEKSKNMKQSLQSFENRKQINKIMRLKKGITLPNQKLLLVDDVVTSGSTLCSAYALIKDHPYDVKALVLSVHPLFVESCDTFLFKK